MYNLQNILDDIPFESLPATWSTIDPASFSKHKSLWDYQQASLQNTLKTLWKYYEDFSDFRSEEPLDTDETRKERYFQWYRDNGIDSDLDISLTRTKREIIRLLGDFYTIKDNKITYDQFINRIGFWMATGSGKTLVIVKLIEFLWHLILVEEIPPNDILVLTHRDDLLEQLRLHVAEFNASRGDLFIHLRDLREFPDVKREMPSLFREREITVFIYRSDNLSDEQKEKIIDFHNYDNDGKWYILLDEAHKGDKQDSKRQHIYSILARHGFLFNFSATFTDKRDIVTTAYNFNLSRFIQAGYGKHISVLKQENRAFRDDEDYTDIEKQKVVLKALILLTYIRHSFDQITGEHERADLYHKPLLLALVNSVNTEEADLKLFFRELKRIGRGEINQITWQTAKDELWQELFEGPEWIFEHNIFTANQNQYDAITLENVLASVYNATGVGEIEVLVRPSNRKELAFKLKTADRPFALIKIGDITDWLKDELAGYEIVSGFDDEGYFERLNADDSDINVLMGSRSFYEGWDSNRPNVITYINIGIGTDARKFILQSIGRGVRIEPIKGQRKRLRSLYNAAIVDEQTFRHIRDYTPALETLFIFGTNRTALRTVIEQLDIERGVEAEHEISIDVNSDAVDDHLLLIPTYKISEKPLIEQRTLAKFPIMEKEQNLLQAYMDYIGDERIIIARHNTKPKTIDLLHRSLAEPDQFFTTNEARLYGSIDLILTRLQNYFALVPKELESLKPLEDEIRHFQHIKVYLEDISELLQKIDQVKGYSNPEQIKEKLKDRFQVGEIDIDEYTVGVENTAKMIKEAQVSYQASVLNVRYIAQHYYMPVILSQNERVEFIQHIIRHPSEVRFINDLEAYLEQEDHKFNGFDWWLFSKLDETLDEVYIPYYDPMANRIRRFNPDFIFWLQKGGKYYIVFVDPKGMYQVDYQYKIDGFHSIFVDDNVGERSISYDDSLSVHISLHLYTRDANQAPERYRKYWFDNIDNILTSLQ